MSTTCEEAAAMTSFERHVDQAFAVVAPEPGAVLPIDRGLDDLTAPSAAHPAARALAAERGSRG